MKVCWLIRVPIVERDGRGYSPLAGVRMRTIVPAEELRRGGHDAFILQLPDSGLLDDAALAALESCDAVFFGPLLPAPDQSIDDSAAVVFALLERLQKRGIKTLADIHDDHFEMPGRIAYFTGLVQKADAVFVNSEAMAKLVAGYTERPLKVVGDPYEGLHGEARFDPAAGSHWVDRLLPWRARRLQLAWFGHQSNLQSIYDLAKTIAEAGLRWPVEISLVSRDGFGAREFCEIFSHHHGRRCRVKFVAWSPESMQRALNDCDLAVIPADVKLRKTAVKSANRVVETLRAGRLAVAYPIPSYLEFADHAWIGEDMIDGIKWAMQHRDEVRARIRSGQDYVEQKFSPQAVGGQWQNALHEILAHARG
jgi:glycosyltransferase involved in cell wall biosynthesis